MAPELRPALLPIILSIFFFQWSSKVLCQQSPPLQGQGIPPYRAGYKGMIVPVYTAVDLVKLISIAEQQYQFEAIFNVELTWYDPRAENIFRVIEAMDLLSEDYDGAASIYPAAVQCGSLTNLTSGGLETNSCKEALAEPPSCRKHCRTYGMTTDNGYRCCDLLWLPDISTSNLLDTTQDRISVDNIYSFKLGNLTYVHRSARIEARFSTPMFFQNFPFDRQQLFMFMLARPGNRVQTIEPGFRLVPSAAFRSLNPMLVQGPDGYPKVSGLAHDELAGWNIDNVTFQCTKPATPGNPSGMAASVDSATLQVQTQLSDPEDPYAVYVKQVRDDATAEVQELQCALGISITRMRNSLVVKTVLPVAFVGGLPFVVFASQPDALDLRLSCGITLFLSLSAVQFTFMGMIPYTSYLTSFDIFILITYGLIVAIVMENLLAYYIVTRRDVQLRRWLHPLSSRDDEQEPSQKGGGIFKDSKGKPQSGDATKGGEGRQADKVESYQADSVVNVDPWQESTVPSGTNTGVVHQPGTPGGSPEGGASPAPSHAGSSSASLLSSETATSAQAPAGQEAASHLPSPETRAFADGAANKGSVSMPAGKLPQGTNQPQSEGSTAKRMFSFQPSFANKHPPPPHPPSSPGRQPHMVGVTPSAAIKTLQTAAQVLADNPGYAFRIALLIDKIVGTFFAVFYVLFSVLLFDLRWENM